MALDEHFDGDSLDEDVWFPYYLPHWSSREHSAATFQLGSEGLRLSIPEDQPLWCPDRHPEPLRVSCIQSGNIPGSQPFLDAMAITEQDTEFLGCLPHFGNIGIRMRGEVSSRSMFAFWLSGIEDTPERSGEICVAEIFGSGIAEGTAEIGMGVHSFRDPGLIEDFRADPLALDPARHHDYEVSWSTETLIFSIDGTRVREIGQALAYPVQMMIGVFDFPDRPGDSSHEPEMTVERVWWREPD